MSSSQLSSLKGHKSQELVVESCVFIFVIIIVLLSFNSAWRSLRYGQIFRFEQVYVYIHFTCCKSRLGSLTQYHYHYNPIQFHCTIPHLQTVLVSARCHLGWVGEPDLTPPCLVALTRYNMTVLGNAVAGWAGCYIARLDINYIITHQPLRVSTFFTPR